MLTGKHIAILAEDNFEDSELLESLQAMKDAGARVVIVGSGSKQIYRGRRGLATIKVDTTADEARVADFDALIIPGGYAPDKMRLYQAMIDLVKAAHDEGKVIGVLQDTGGITQHLEKIISMINKETDAIVCYDANPERLLNKLENIYTKHILPEYLKVLEDHNPDGELDPEI